MYNVMCRTLHVVFYFQITVPITPLREGELEVLGFIYNLCVDGSQSKGATSPLPTSSSRANLLSMSVNSRESLYQVYPCIFSCINFQ